ncbi:MAG TPA: MraY family glycosyltransferase [Gemmataceae bacterium]|nr:MraY family glycosyltransferase [Gemmataceae bacterium]
MLTLLALFALSLGLSILLTPLARALAGRWGLTDKPDRRRKLHGQNIPVAGGIAVLLASLTTIALMLVTGLCPWSEEFNQQAAQWLGLAAASVLISCVGVIDDWGRLRGRHKIFGQVLAIGILIATGLVVKTIRVADFEIDLGLMAIPFTAFFLLGAINSLNLLDGMDGLLSTVALIVTLAFTGMAVLGEKWTTACIAVTMAGSLLGFLRYNFPPASIYLGDTGSMLIGLVIGSLAIKSSLKGAATAALAAPMAILAIPILDTMAAIFRRKLTGRSIYTTDRGHLHHCLLRQGFSKVTVLLFVSLFCLVAVAGAFLSITLNSEWLALLAAFTVAVILVRMRWFGHGEVLLVSDRLKGLASSLVRLRRSVGPRHSAIRLQGNSGAWTDVWGSLTQSAEELALKTLRLDINAPAFHESFNARWVNPSQEDAEQGITSWNVAIPLICQDQTMGRLEVSGMRDDQPVWMKIAVLTKIVDELELTLSKIADEAGLPTRPYVASAPQPRQPVLDLNLTE